MLRIYLIGSIILISAIVMNGVINRLGIMGWYDFLTAISQTDERAHARLRVVDGLWLFLVYPALLGLAAVWADRILSLAGLPQ